MRTKFCAIAVLLTSIAVGPGVAQADACSDAINQGNALAQRIRELNAADWGPKCSAQYFRHGQRILALRRQRIPILERSDTACGSRLVRKVSSAEYRAGVEDYAASLEQSRRLCEAMKGLKPDKPATTKRSDSAPAVTPVRMNPEPACLKSEPAQGIPCITPAGVRQSELTIVVRNECNRSVKIQLCFQLTTGAMRCSADFRFAAHGETYSKHQCLVTGRYWVKALATGKR